MIDIWGRPISVLKDSTETPATDDIKKLIEDEIAETLNLTSVDPGEIVVFQDRQGKLKSSNVSLDDVLTRQRDAAENTIALYTSDGRLKSGEYLLTITDGVTLIQDDLIRLDRVTTELYKRAEKSVADMQLTITNFFGAPPVTKPNITTIKSAIDVAEVLRTEYNAHITRFNALQKNNSALAGIINKFLGTPPSIVMTLAEIKAAIDNQKPNNDAVVKFFKAPLAVDITLPEIKAFMGKQKAPRDAVDKFFENINNANDVAERLLDIILYIHGQQALEVNEHIHYQKRTRVNELNMEFFGSPLGISKPTLSEIKTFMGKQKTPSDVVDKFFGNTALAGIKTLYDINQQLLYLKFIHSPHEHIKNIVYVVDKGVLDWIRGANINITADTVGVAGIYRLSWIAKEQFNILVWEKSLPPPPRY